MQPQLTAGRPESPILCRAADAAQFPPSPRALNLQALAAVQGFAPRSGDPGVPACVTDGPAPRLAVRRADGQLSYLTAGRDAVAEAARWVAPALASSPPWIVLLGPGLGAAIDAVHRLRPSTRVLVVETDGNLLDAFLTARDWRPLVADGRLRVLGANPLHEAAAIWHHLGIDTAPPVVVAPAYLRALADLVARNRMAYAACRFGSPLDPRRPSVGLSMLRYDVIVALEHLASSVDGPVIEVGPYVGGSTLAIGRGLRAAGRRGPFLTIEKGGAYPTHPSLPSDDILGDLRHNLHAAGMTDLVTVLEGMTTDTAVHSRVREALDGRPVALVVIDADGHVDRDLDVLLPLCRPGALIAIDDYVAPEAQENAAPTQRAVDARVESGLLRPLGLYGWGTWFGTYAGPIDADATTTDFPYTFATAGVL